MSPASRLRLFYFLYYGSVGAFLPYFSPYLRGLGWSGETIGTVQLIAPLVAAPSAILWATAADRLGAPARALALATLWAALAAALLPVARTPLAVAAVLLAMSLADRSVVPLVDAVTIEWVHGRPGRSYARIRLFGSLGYIAVTQALGLALSARGDRDGDVAVPLAFAALVAGYAIVARRLPSAPASGPRPGVRDLLGLLRRPRLALLLAACAIHWAACAPWHLLFGVFVRDAGLPSAVTGLGMAVGVAAEVVVLLAFPRLERRWPPHVLLAAAFAGSALRWLLLARAEGAAAVVAIQALHGLTFGAFWGAAVNALAREVPAALRATGQALFSAVVAGGGNVVGYALSGRSYDLLGSVAPLYGWAGLTEIIALIVWLAGLRWLRAPPARAEDHA